MRWSILSVLLALLAGCSGAASGPTLSGPAWTEVPLGDGPASVALGDLVRCADRWYASGASRRPVADPDRAAGESAVANAPALWSSADGRSWSPGTVAPVSYYGARQVLTGVTCRAGGIVALGAATGGAHGNPRVSTWRSTGGGALAEVDAPIERYGGPRAITVNTVAGGPGGWLVAGNRVGVDGGPTAAVWLSGDGAGFTEHTDAAGLASTPDTVTMARGVTATPAGWLLWGDTRRVTELVREPALWSSADGLTWRAERPAPVTGDASISAAGVDGDRVLAMGTQGGAPHAWFRDAAGWVDAGGPPVVGGRGVARVGQVVLTARDAYAAVDDGGHWSLWRSTDLRGWARVPLPVEPATGADSRLRMAVSDDLLVVAESDAGGAHLWVTDRPR